MATADRASVFTIGGTTVPPGRRTDLELPVAGLPTGTAMSMPVAVVHGRRRGPAVWLSAAVHGDEICGVEIVRRILGAIAPRELRGTLVAVPVVNVFGFISESRYLPDRRDLNRSFPGSPRGSLAARLAHLFMTEVVGRCEVGIDLHTGTDHRHNHPQVRADLSDGRTAQLASAFGAPLIVDARLRDGSLREAATARGIPVLVYEGGQPHRFDAAAIEVGTEGVMRVLAALGMIDRATPPPGPGPVVISSSRWVRARRSGLFSPWVDGGQPVTARQPVGAIVDALGRRTLQVRAPFDGYVLGINRNPLVTQGEALVHIGEPAQDA